MRAIFATPLIPPEIGGPATYIKELCERLHNEIDITVVAYASTAEPIPGVRLRTVSKNRPLPLRLAKYALVLFVEARSADLIYVQNAAASGLPAVLVGMLLGKPVIIKFVGDEAWERATLARKTTLRLEEFLARPEGGLHVRLLMLLQGFVLRRATRVTTPSAYLRDAIVRTYGVSPERALVNYNAAEETEVPPFEAARVPRQIFTSARLVQWKGVDGIIRALGLLRARIPDARLVIAGDGPEETRLKELAKSLGLESAVEFLGRVSRTETWHLRKSSDVYVLNSTYEGLPHTVLTSFAAGIPTIATDIPGTNEAVYDGVSGLLVPSGDDAKLAEAIERLMEDPALQERLINGGLELLKDKFSWDAHIRTLRTLFSDLQKASAQRR